MNHYEAVLQEFAPVEPYVLSALVDRGGILEIHLIDADGRKACLTFDSHLGYRKLDEGDDLIGLAELSATARPGRSFYRVTSSELVEWFVSRGHGTRKAGSILHFVVTTVDDVIDVLALAEPVFRSE
jgi:hypothetical protein